MRETLFTKGADGKSVIIERSFSASRSKVWEAWTTSALLDEWWGPKPWNAVTKEMDFREGGRWLNAMTGPDGTKQWCVEEYHTIDPERSFTATDAFSDENGVPDDSFPRTEWLVVFTDEGTGTKMTVTCTYATPEDLAKITEMGFQEGFTMGLNQLDALLG